MTKPPTLSKAPLEASSTIVALVTPPVVSGVGILRVSGPQALGLCFPLCKDLPKDVQPRHAYFTAIGSTEILDEGLFLYFKGPHSFTGEDVVELQLHGNPLLLKLLQTQLLEGGARLASPGEFSRRAFTNGRIDLARAEAIADLVSSNSEAALKAAARQLRGNVSRLMTTLRDGLMELHADLEGVLNFPDEAEGADEDAQSRLAVLLESIRTLRAQAETGNRLRRGGRVVLFGPSNAGKSTLFNALVGSSLALVDEEPGTTRDALPAEWMLGGLPVTLVDTAGLQDYPSRVEALGIEKTHRAVEGADLVLLILPASASEPDRSQWRARLGGGVVQLNIASKCDLAGQSKSESSKPDSSWLWVSASTGEGLEELRAKVSQLLWGMGSPEAVVVTSARHAEALLRAEQALDRAKASIEVSTTEITAGEVALAAEALGEITGETVSDCLMDAIFNKFCIGK